MTPRDNDPPLVAGGQGRSAEDVRRDCRGCAGILSVVVGGLIGWAIVVAAVALVRAAQS